MNNLAWRLVAKCPGSASPIARGAEAVCLCGKKFSIAEKCIPEHEVMGVISPNFLPDEAPAEFPAPWKLDGFMGNGHCHIFDSNAKIVAHIYCYDESEFTLLQIKLDKINGIIRPYKGEIWRMTLGGYQYDYEILGVGDNLTTHGDHKQYVMLRGMGHNDNVIEMSNFLKRFKKI